MLPVHQFQNLPRKETSKNERGVTDPNARFCPKSPRYFGTTATATVPARVASNSVASEIRAQQNGFE
jgi:hypothetical protein